MGSLPGCRTPPFRLRTADAIIELAMGDTLRAFAGGRSRQAAEEFPATLAALRAELPVTDELSLVGGSLGGFVALRVLASGAPVTAAALVNPLIRARTLVDVIDSHRAQPYAWDPIANTLADHLDFVRRAEEITVPLLVISGENDDPPFRADAAALAAAAPRAELLTVPDLAHPLADEPGIEPAQQLPGAKLVDDALTEWFTRHLP